MQNGSNIDPATPQNTGNDDAARQEIQRRIERNLADPRRTPPDPLKKGDKE
jgi:hypothetical protein